MNKRGSTRLDYMIKLLPFIRSNGLLSFLIICSKLCILIITLLLPLMYKYFMNQVITAENLDKIPSLILGYVCLFLLQTVFIICSKYFENKFYLRLKLRVKKKLLDIYTTISFKEFRELSTSDIRIQVEEDTQLLCNFYVTHCVDFIFSIIRTIVICFIILFMSWHLTVFGLIMIALSLFITRIVGKKIKQISEQYRGYQGEFESTIKEIIHNWKEIKTGNLQQAAESLLTNKWKELSGLLMRRTFFQYLYSALIAINLVFVTRMNLYFLGGILVMYNFITVSTMLVFMNYYEQVFSDIQTLSGSMIGLSSEVSRLHGIFAVLDRLEERQYINELPDKFVADLHINHLSFQYQAAYEQALKDVNLEIKRNEKTAVVGKSGCGKSTLVKLLLGLYESDRGSLFLGDVNLNKIAPVLRNKIMNGVLQDPVFLNISILENLRLAKSDAAPEDIDRVCKLANIYDFIRELPEKYDTVIGERGVRLSGGQRQRLAIARVLLLEPQIIIFDEATSSLDSESESKIVSSIEGLAKSRTILSVAHRYSTIAGYENVVVLQDGEVVMQGRMSELLEDKGLASSIFSGSEGSTMYIHK